MNRSPIRRNTPLARTGRLRQSPLRRVSPAKATWQAKYRRALAKRLQEHPMCEAFLTVPATDGHHFAGRIGQRIMCFIVVSREAHDRIHGNPNEARRLGWLYDERHPERLNQACREAAIRGGMPELLKS